jgi:hypothetical protein
MFNVEPSNFWGVSLNEMKSITVAADATWWIKIYIYIYIFRNSHSLIDFCDSVNSPQKYKINRPQPG